MSAIKLMEKLGSNASLQNVEAVEAMMAGSSLTDLEQNKEKMWCLMFPAEGEESDEDSEENDESENKEEISH